MQHPLQLRTTQGSSRPLSPRCGRGGSLAHDARRRQRDRGAGESSLLGLDMVRDDAESALKTVSTAIPFRSLLRPAASGRFQGSPDVRTRTSNILPVLHRRQGRATAAIRLAGMERCARQLGADAAPARAGGRARLVYRAHTRHGWGWLALQHSVLKAHDAAARRPLI